MRVGGMATFITPPKTRVHGARVLYTAEGREPQVVPKKGRHQHLLPSLLFLLSPTFASTSMYARDTSLASSVGNAVSYRVRNVRAIKPTGLG